jgi:hypothetical protein
LLKMLQTIGKLDLTIKINELSTPRHSKIALCWSSRVFRFSRRNQRPKLLLHWSN